MIAPLLALVAHVAASCLALTYSLVFALLGLLNSTYMLGYANYTLEIAPPGLSTAYIGTANTLVGLLSLMPLVGGWVLQVTSYPVLFGLALTSGAWGFLIALGLPACRRRGYSGSGC